MVIRVQIQKGEEKRKNGKKKRKKMLAPFPAFFPTHPIPKHVVPQNEIGDILER